MIFGSRRRTRSRWGRTGPMTRGVGALSRAVGIAWRRSLQLRVVGLTLALSLVVILALGFVLTSQLTNRVLDVKVKAAIEQIERARTTVSGIVNGEETRSLDSSLQLARNTLTSKTDPASGAGLAGAFDAAMERKHERRLRAVDEKPGGELCGARLKERRQRVAQSRPDRKNRSGRDVVGEIG